VVGFKCLTIARNERAQRKVFDQLADDSQVILFKVLWVVHIWLADLKTNGVSDPERDSLIQQQ
jgi:hypothetical protein